MHPPKKSPMHGAVRRNRPLSHTAQSKPIQRLPRKLFIPRESGAVQTATEI